MAGCGLRVSEVAALKAEHVDSAGGYLHVVNGKGGKQRTCVIPWPALDALGAYLQGRESGYVFEGRHQCHIFTRQIQRLLDEIAEVAGLQETRPGKVRQRKKVTPHLLRHSFSRWTLDVGIDITYLAPGSNGVINSAIGLKICTKVSFVSLRIEPHSWTALAQFFTLSGKIHLVQTIRYSD